MGNLTLLLFKFKQFSLAQMASYIGVINIVQVGQSSVLGLMCLILLMPSCSGGICLTWVVQHWLNVWSNLGQHAIRGYQTKLYFMFVYFHS